MKNGDKVRIIDKGSSRNKVGDIGIVACYNNHDDSFRVEVPGRYTIVNWHSHNQVELIRDEELIYEIY